VSNTCIIHLTRVVIAFDSFESLGREALRDPGDIENRTSSEQDVLKSLTLARTSNHPKKDTCRISSEYHLDITLRILPGYRSNRLQDIGV
jgi:hypothetical protein